MNSDKTFTRLPIQTMGLFTDVREWCLIDYLYYRSNLKGWIITVSDIQNQTCLKRRERILETLNTCVLKGWITKIEYKTKGGSIRHKYNFDREAFDKWFNSKSGPASEPDAGPASEPVDGKSGPASEPELVQHTDHTTNNNNTAFKNTRTTSTSPGKSQAELEKLKADKKRKEDLEKADEILGGINNDFNYRSFKRVGNIPENFADL